jgi:hypothetical protein
VKLSDHVKGEGDLPPKKERKMNTSRKTAIAVGVLILLAYSLLGSAILESKIIGMFLEAISGLAVIAIAVLMFPLFKPYNEKASLLYIALRGIEGGLMIIAGVLLLSDSNLLLKIRDGIWLGHGYIFAVAALVFYYLLYQSNLGEVTGIIPASMILYLPVILNEIVLAIWLIVKGFNPSAIVSEPA